MPSVYAPYQDTTDRGSLEPQCAVVAAMAAEVAAAVELREGVLALSEWRTGGRAGELTGEKIARQEASALIYKS